MKGEIVPVTGRELAAFAYAEFFGAEIESPHTHRVSGGRGPFLGVVCRARGDADPGEPRGGRRVYLQAAGGIQADQEVAPVGAQTFF